MERPLVPIVFLVLVSFCRGQDWVVQTYCDYSTCPAYQLKSETVFEERLYNETMWISTMINGTESSDLLAAHERLKEYCETQEAAGYAIPYAWPVMITITSGSNFVMSWFIPTGTNLSEITDPLVTLHSRPAATIYVRLFNGIPSIQNGQINEQILRTDLSAAGKDFDLHTYSGAGYESYFSLTHHNEIWIQAA